MRNYAVPVLFLKIALLTRLTCLYMSVYTMYACFISFIKREKMFHTVMYLPRYQSLKTNLHQIFFYYFHLFHHRVLIYYPMDRFRDGCNELINSPFCHLTRRNQSSFCLKMDKKHFPNERDLWVDGHRNGIVTRDKNCLKLLMNNLLFYFTLYLLSSMYGPSNKH